MSQSSPPGFVLQMDVTFSNVEIIRVFTSTVVAICSATSYPFEFSYRIKRPPLDILKFLVPTLRNHDDKVIFILVDEDGALAISSEFMKTCNNLKITVQTTDRYASSINGRT